MFDYKYLTEKDLKGFDNYKYSALDTSPLSNYVMHPLWNTLVKIVQRWVAPNLMTFVGFLFMVTGILLIVPRWVAPNLMTFVGFLCMVTSVLLVCYFDYDCASSGAPLKHQNGYHMPNWVLTLCGVLIFVSYHLDGMDGKQARRIGVSGPLGEMFDHGFDSYVVFMIPFCLFSVFGRDVEYSVPIFRGYLIVMSVVLNFYLAHWEKYNTGTLYIPWGYDVSMWVSSFLLIIAGVKGPEIYKYYVFGNVTFVQALEVAIHATGLFTTLPISIYNLYLYRKNNKSKLSFIESIRPLWSILLMTVVMTVWAVKSPNDVIEKDPRAFLFLFGTLFSHIASRLIVAEITGQRCEAICGLFWPVLTGVIVSLCRPQLEMMMTYILLTLSVLLHVHYGICVVRQICDYFKISCFTVPKTKRK